jgi:uncharacterized protein involved in tellurium resistance
MGLPKGLKYHSYSKLEPYVIFHDDQNQGDINGRNNLCNYGPDNGIIILLLFFWIKNNGLRPLQGKTK